MHCTGTVRAICRSMKESSTAWIALAQSSFRVFGWAAFLATTVFLGCGGATGPPQSPPPSGVGVTLTPASSSVLLGLTQTFVPSVTGSSNTTVTWSVNGVPGGDAAVGTVDASGVYTAPRDLPVLATVTLAATSVADSTKTATSAVTITSDISIVVTPPTMPIELGAVRAFAAAINSAGNPDRAMNWIVSGSGCAGTACGSIDSAGNYTAPQDLTAPPNVTLIAVSMADHSKSASAAITITSTFTLAVSGPTSVNAGATTNFVAVLTPAANSNPDPTIAWSVSGAGCTGAACGVISASGVYTAPQIPPSPASVRITATPAADVSKAASVSVGINPVVSAAISPSSAVVPVGGTQAFHASVTGAQDTSVTWDVGGIVGGNSTLGTILNSQTDPNDTTYTAPTSLLQGGSAVVHARSNASPGVVAAATVTVSGALDVTLTPASSTRTIGHRQTFAAQVNNSPDQNVVWQVNGVAGGDLTVGQICAQASNPCQPTSTTNGGSVDYLAPAGVPSPNPVTLTATSAAEPMQSAAAPITILPHDVVSVLPSSATLAAGGRQLFTVSVLGSDNQQVVWTISGAGCGGAGSACGTVDQSGLYTAPAVAPAPNLITIMATSAEDSSRAATATVTITSNANIATLAPSSAYAGSAGGFTLEVQGGNFVASSPGPGSSILVGGTARTTSCAFASACTTSLAATDLTSPGNLSVQVENPDGSLSNTVSFVVLDPGTGIGSIPLTSGAPNATGVDIVVVDLSTNGGAGASGNVSLAVAALGSFNVATSTCVLAGSPTVVTRPATGTASADLCVFSLSGLDPSYTYTVSGPASPDIIFTNREPLGLGIVHLTLQVPATAAAGSRTLFIETANKDKAAATGALEVK